MCSDITVFSIFVLMNPKWDVDIWFAKMRMSRISGNARFEFGDFT